VSTQKVVAVTDNIRESKALKFNLLYRDHVHELVVARLNALITESGLESSDRLPPEGEV
jgi:hypothetical protein